MDDSSIEQRRSERCKAKHFLDYAVISPQGEIVGHGLARTLNVSDTGLLLETGQQFAAGQILRITLGLNEELVQLTGAVVHSGPNAAELCNTGVHFLEFTATDHRTFQHYLETLKRALSD